MAVAGVRHKRLQANQAILADKSPLLLPIKRHNASHPAAPARREPRPNENAHQIREPLAGWVVRDCDLIIE